LLEKLLVPVSPPSYPITEEMTWSRSVSSTVLAWSTSLALGEILADLAVLPSLVSLHIHLESVLLFIADQYLCCYCPSRISFHQLKVDARMKPLAESNWQFKDAIVGSKNNDVSCRVQNR
jgi:hypothetical protein